jgi:hypothetical protein
MSANRIGKPDDVPAVRSYITGFKADENPIAEGGIWLNGRDEGIDWANILTEDGLAHGAASSRVTTSTPPWATTTIRRQS